MWGPGEDKVCNGYRRLGPNASLKGAGPKMQFTVGCETAWCNYSYADSRMAPRRRTFTGRMSNLKRGWYEVLVATPHARDEGFRIGFCLKGYANGGLAQVSNLAVVRSIDYRLEGSTLVARVYANERDLPNGVTVDDPGGLIFEAR